MTARAAPGSAALLSVALLAFAVSAVGQDAPSIASVGTPQRGHLAGRGEELPERGEGFHWVTNRGNRDARFGTPALVGALVRAAGVVARAHVGSDLAIHDLSRPAGARLRGHGSHRSGRDADVAYYALGPDGAPLNPTTSVWFAPSGRARGVRAELAPRFDPGRNWLLFTTLLSDDAIRVQYVFMHPALQRTLLDYGRGEDAAQAAALEEVLRTPHGRRVDPHADHFHVRIHCPPADVARGCER